ncbi:restriction endonuclease subunit S [Mammaliicoccus sciuri]|uniref:restriction endonuclease subunit S n=1 Tax=Mammaliicoccus sciuri TaxID=1296 RepID=UPI002DC03887|nr:restriction endonuclease subunit S [Mammaliicoccus sciuri]MEB7067103.1 restriction endonuclease subunit S [Mammaliicoccus sciuri]
MTSQLPELRFKGFSGDWEEKKLGDVSEKSMYGLGASAINYDGQNVYVRITDIDDKSRNIKSKSFTSPNVIDPKYELNKDDILFARTGASTGKSYIHSKFDKDKSYYFAGFLIKFQINSSSYPQFIFQYTFTSKYKNWVNVMSMRSGQPGINSEEYSKLNIYLPLFKEQQKIGTFFKQLDDTIELYQIQLNLLKEQKKGFLQKMFPKDGEKVPEIRFKGFNDYWEEKKLNELVHVGTGKSKINDIKEGTFDILGSTGIIGKSDNYDYDGEFILIARVGHYAGKSYKYSGKIKISDNTIFLQNVKNKDFIYECLNKYKLKKLVFGTGQPLIKSSDIKNFKLLLPSKNEQQKIGAFFKQLDENIELLENKLNDLNKLKKGFLQKMFV